MVSFASLFGGSSTAPTHAQEQAPQRAIPETTLATQAFDESGNLVYIDDIHDDNSEEDQECDEYREDVLPDLYNEKLCSGNVMPHPKDYSNIDDLDKAIEDWFLNAYHLRDHWVYQTRCVWEGRKIAIMNYSFWPKIKRQRPLTLDDEQKLLVQYIATTKCNVRIMNYKFDDQMCSILYDVSKWREAVLLLLLHKGLLGIVMGGNRYVPFQSMLLGYTLESTFESAIDKDYILEHLRKANLLDDTIEAYSVTKLADGREVKTDHWRAWQQLRTPEARREWYLGVYEEMYVSESAKERLARFTELWNSLRQYLQQCLGFLDMDIFPRLKAYAQGGDLETLVGDELAILKNMC